VTAVDICADHGYSFCIDNEQVRMARQRTNCTRSNTRTTHENVQQVSEEARSDACRIARPGSTTAGRLPQFHRRSSIEGKVVSGHAYAIPAQLPVRVVGAELTPTYVSAMVFELPTRRAPALRRRGPADVERR